MSCVFELPSLLNSSGASSGWPPYIPNCIWTPSLTRQDPTPGRQALRLLPAVLTGIRRLSLVSAPRSESMKARQPPPFPAVSVGQFSSAEPHPWSSCVVSTQELNKTSNQSMRVNWTNTRRVVVVDSDSNSVHDPCTPMRSTMLKLVVLAPRWSSQGVI